MLHWTLHLNGGAHRSRRTAVVVENKVYCFEIEAVNQYDQIEVHVFNTVTLRWVKVPPVSTGQGEAPLEVPSMQPGHTAVLIEDIAYVCGRGDYGTVPMVLYVFDVDTHRWSQPKVSGTVPGSRHSHSACILGKVMYIHGGMISGSCLCDCYKDVYKIDTTTMVWSLIKTRGSKPPPSSMHSATIIGTKMFVFGGDWASAIRIESHAIRIESHNYIRVFDTETNRWLDIDRFAQPLPHDRRGFQIQHAAIAYNGELYIFISCEGDDYDLLNDNDLWKLNPETFSWKRVEPKGKGPAGQIRMCCCMVGDRIVLFTGHDGQLPVPTVPTDDLYILDLHPSLKTLCELAVIGYGLEKSGLPHNIRWEMAAGPGLGIGKEEQCPPKCPVCPTKHDGMKKSKISKILNYVLINV